MDSDSTSVPPGDRWYVVLIAYFVVLLPWAAIQAIDFIGPNWKTVQRTRRNGRFQFWVTLIPLVVMMVYVVLQIMARDFKEMSAAIVAICFALLHLLRTWWGLWQLRLFQTWATNAIEILESQGVRYNLEITDEEEAELNGLTLTQSYAWKAAHIQINETIVDNQILEGDTRCRVVFRKRGKADKLPKRPWKNDSSGFLGRLFTQTRIDSLEEPPANQAEVASNILSHLSRSINNLGKDVKKNFRSFLSAVKHVSRSIRLVLGNAERREFIREMILEKVTDLLKVADFTRDFRLVPYEPTEVWIRWAVAFAAQGLGDWVTNFDCMPDPGPPNGSSAGFENRQRYFAREILASACLLHDEIEQLPGQRIISGPGHPLQWNLTVLTDTDGNKRTGRSSFDKTGKISQREMLLHALLTGTRLPFDAPHIKNDKSRAKVYRNLQNSGFQSYQYDVQQVSQSMPAKFGNTIDDFKYEHLECLTIMLSLGVWEQIELDSVENYEDYSYFESERRKNAAPLQEDDLPAIMLKGQVGIRAGSSKIVKVPKEPADSETEEQNNISFLSSLPISVFQKNPGKLFGDNSSVLELSAVIDIWSSLNAGDTTKFVLDKDTDWTAASLNSQGRTRRASFSERSPRDSQEKYLHGSKDDSIIGDTSVYRCNDISELEGPSPDIDFRGANCALEKVRLATEFGKGGESEYHLSQSVSFLGIAMESVRSALAKGIQDKQPESTMWRPEIEYTSTNNRVCTDDILECEFSECFSSAFCAASSGKKGVRKFLQKRSAQIRLVWELQRECTNRLSGGVSPQNPFAMLGCILAFPSLTCRVKSIPTICASKMAYHTSIEFKDSPCMVSITPVGAPQDLSVNVFLRAKKSKIAWTARIRRSDASSDLKFEWQLWRDSFSGRLQGAREWREEHGLLYFTDCTTYGSISRGFESRPLGDPRHRDNPQGKSEMTLWMGWLPNQPKICEFEMNTRRGVWNESDYHRTLIEQRVREMEIAQSRAQRKQVFIMEILEKNYGNETMDEHLKREYSRYEKGQRTETYIWRLLDLAASSGYESCMSRGMQIVKTGSRSYRLKRALSLINNYVSFGERMNRIIPPFDRRIEEWYIDIVELSEYDSKAVRDLCRYERMHFKFKSGKINEKELFAMLRKSFMRTGQAALLEEMILLGSYCGSLKQPKGPLGSSVVFPEKVTGWGAWLIVEMYNRFSRQLNGQAESPNFNSSLLNLCRKGEKDFKWMEMVLKDYLSCQKSIDFLENLTKNGDTLKVRRRLAEFLEREARMSLTGKGEGELYGEVLARRRTAAAIIGRLRETGTDVAERNLFESVYYHGIAMSLGLESSVLELNNILTGQGKHDTALRYWIINGFSHCIVAGDGENLKDTLFECCSNLIRSRKELMPHEVEQLVDAFIEIMKREDMTDVFLDQERRRWGRALFQVVQNKDISVSVRQKAFDCLRDLASNPELKGHGAAKLFVSTLVAERDHISFTEAVVEEEIQKRPWCEAFLEVSHLSRQKSI